MFSTKAVPHDASASAFTVPATRSSAFNRVAAVANPASRRNVPLKEETADKSGSRMVWHASSNEQVYRMAQISNPSSANGSNSIIQIPHSLQSHPAIYIDQSGLASHQFYPYQSSSQSSSVPIVINPREINNSNISYLTSALNQAQRPAILRKLSKPSERQEDIKDSNCQNSYFQGDSSVYNMKEKAGGSAATSISKNAKLKPPNTDPYLFADSPRKKPRKQAVVAHEDVFASNVPEPSTAAKIENTGAPVPVTKQEEEQIQEEETISFYPPRKRMSLLPPSSKCPARVLNHFEKHTDIKVKKKKNKCNVVPEMSIIATEGWRLMHLKSQMEDISTVQRETKSKLCEYKDYFSNISLEIEDKGSGARANNESIADLLQNINHCCQSNVTQLKQNISAIDKIMNSHKPKIFELLRDTSKDTKSIAVSKKTPPHRHNTPTQQRKTEPTPSSTKRTRKRKT